MSPKRLAGVPEYFTMEKVSEITGLSATTIKGRMQAGTFPKSAAYYQDRGSYSYLRLFLKTDVYDWIREHGPASSRGKDGRGREG